MYALSKKDKDLITENKIIVANIYSSSEARAKIIEDWATAYCIKKGLEPDDVVLVQRFTPEGVVYYFEKKKSKSKERK